MQIARVALAVPVATLFDYRATALTRADVGRRVLVPFGRRQEVGIICEVAAQSELPAARLKPVARIFDDMPALPADVLALCRFCSEYYHHPLGEIVLAALPGRLRQTRPLKQSPARCYALTAAGFDRAGGVGAGIRSVQQRLLALLRDGGVVGIDRIRQLSTRAMTALNACVANGWIEARTPAPPLPAQPVPAPRLSAEQTAALDSIRAGLGAFQTWVLHGVTGSGKTEIYFHLIAETLARGQQALLLVPEINLTPQVETLFRARFPAAELVALHSGLAEGERLDNWLKAQSGRARVVLGTRLAAFAPLPELGLIVVDEEHDASFKQTEGLRYSARDLAVLRAQQRGVTVVLGSATPSLETLYKAETGRYRIAELTQRINARPPRIGLIDVRRQPLRDGLSGHLLAAIRRCLDGRDQALVFINRRGYAPVLACHECAWVAPCHRCSARLVLHLRDARLRCHHCGHEERVPVACPECGNQNLAPLGSGTQRVESALAQAFPQARVLRIDRDSTRRKLAWRDMRERIERELVDILVGTQLLAKGHDFPKLNLVGVLNADASLYSADFRASERLFAQLMQVAGRAGRGETVGEVLIQTEFPTHPLFAALEQYDYRAFARTLLAEREQAGFPPFTYQALLRAEAPRLQTALDFLERARARAQALPSAHGIALYEPVAASMMRLAGRERAQLLAQCVSRKRLQRFIAQWTAALGAAGERNVRWAFDVDPLDI